MHIITQRSLMRAAAALALLTLPTLAAAAEPAPTSVAAASTTALRAATAAVLSSGAVPNVPAALARAEVLEALQRYPFCGDKTITVDHPRSLLARFGDRVPLAVMNLIVSEPTLTLGDLTQHLRTLRAWVRSGALAGDKVAALVAALKDQVDAIVVGRTAELAAETAPAELADLRARAVDNLRRELIDTLAGNDSARAVREVRLALASDSPGVRASAARVAMKQRGQPLRALVAAICEHDTADVQELVCPEL